MPQNLSIGCTISCAEACSVVVKATKTETLIVTKNDRWNLSLINMQIKFNRNDATYINPSAQSVYMIFIHDSFAKDMTG